MSNLTVLWSEKMLDMISIFLNSPRSDLWPKMGSSILRMFHVLLRKGIFFCIWIECPKMSMRAIFSNVSFKTCVSLLIFCFDDLSIGVSGALKNLWLSLCYCQFLLLCLLVFVLCIEVLLCWVHRYLQLLCLPLGLIPRSLLVSFLISCNGLSYKVYIVWYEDYYSSFLCFPFAWNIFFHPLTLSLYVSLGQKWVSCRQQIYGSCFCILSTRLCLLVGAFNPFTFEVIFDICVPIAIFLIVWNLFL